MTSNERLDRPVLTEAHLFRIPTRLRVPGHTSPLLIPVTGVCIVSHLLSPTHDHVVSRQAAVAHANALEMQRRQTRQYLETLAAATRGKPANLPSTRLRHENPAQHCEACRAAALCTMNEAEYKQLRADLAYALQTNNVAMTSEHLARFVRQLNFLLCL